MNKIDTFFGPSWKIVKAALVLVGICGQCLLGFSQPDRIYFDHITTEEGLSQNDVNCILQDSKGFMWFGTNDGLNRYDGYEFTVFKPDPANPNSICSNLILSLEEDPLGRIWIGTAGSGLTCFDPATQQFHHVVQLSDEVERVGQYHILDLMLDNKGFLWMATIGGLQVLEVNVSNKEDGLFRNRGNILLPPNLATEYIESVFQDEDHAIWIGSRQGLFRLQPTKSPGEPFFVEHVPISSDLPALQVRAISKTKEGSLVIGTQVGVFYQTDVKAGNIPVFTRFTSLYAAGVEIDQFNQIWVAGLSGLACYRKKETESLPQVTGAYSNNLQDPNSLNKDVLRAIYAGRNGMMWVGTNGGGVNKFDLEKSAFNHFKKNLQAGSISYDKIRSVFEDSEGNIWMGTEGGGLDFLATKWDNGKYDQFQHLNEPSNVFSITEAKEGNEKVLYFGGQNVPGLYKMKIPDASGNFGARNASAIQEINQAVFALLNEDNKRLWIGTYNGGLLQMELNSSSSTPVIRQYQYDPQNPQSIPNNIIRSLLRDRSGNIWIGTGAGLGMIPHDQVGNDPLHFVRFHHVIEDPHSLSHNYILALYESRAGDLWIGTFGGGLNKLVPATENRPAHFIRFTENDGLANNVVKGILEDEAGNLWIASNKGLSLFNPNTNTFKNYDTHDGLQSNEFSEIACLKRRNGEMLFGGVNGFNVFDPASFRDNTHLPEVVFTGFQLLNKPVSVGQKVNDHIILQQDISETTHIQLRYNENSFSLEFAALHFAAPGKNQYQYKLENFDESWISVSAQKRFATYTNLSPGDYVIHVRASNNDGIWNEQATSITIHISPPFWLAWWAYLVYGLLIAAALIAFRRYTIIGIKEKHDLMLEHIEKEKSEELHQMKFQFFTNISHELRTPLTLISGPLEYLIKSGQGLDYDQREYQYHLIQKNANFLLRLVNQLLDFRKLDQGKMNLQVRKGNVVDFIYEITEPFQFIANKKDIDYQVSSTRPDIELWFDSDILEKTLYNLLSNAFKFTPGSGRIRIEVDPRYDSSRRKKIRKTGTLEIRVRDTGPGVQADKKEQIFERFFKSSQTESGNKEGAGIGLAFTKSLVELHHGNIWVESEEGKGACFIVSLPLGKGSYNKRETSNRSARGSAVEIAFDPLSYLSESIEEEEFRNGDSVAWEGQSAELPLLLIIDDHKDIRTFIHQSMGKEYRMIEAAEGVQGWELALEQMPDLIISDVMMPKMDGIELCRRLKTNPKTSHIPVILLTARSSDESELEGISIGADAYIRKPFSMDLLKAQIQNILHQRQELKNRFRREILLQPEEVTVTSTDELFLKKAMDLVEEHMGDPDFSVEIMVKEIGMSRSKLYLKLKALTDQSTSEFIRTVRLKRAVQLLESSDMTVKEIMYMTGFNTSSYFSKCFKKQFGVSPSEYLKTEQSTGV